MYINWGICGYLLVGSFSVLCSSRLQRPRVSGLQQVRASALVASLLLRCSIRLDLLYSARAGACLCGSPWSPAACKHPLHLPPRNRQCHSCCAFSSHMQKIWQLPLKVGPWTQSNPIEPVPTQLNLLIPLSTNIT